MLDDDKSKDAPAPQAEAASEFAPDVKETETVAEPEQSEKKDEAKSSASGGDIKSTLNTILSDVEKVGNDVAKGLLKKLGFVEKQEFEATKKELDRVTEELDKIKKN